MTEGVGERATATAAAPRGATYGEAVRRFMLRPEATALAARSRSSSPSSRPSARTSSRPSAASELARNTVEHGGGGTARVELLADSGRRGLRLTCEDQGPGIADISLALKDGYTTRGCLGLGLPGARRLVNDFTIDSRPGEGTRVAITRWK